MTEAGGGLKVKEEGGREEVDEVVLPRLWLRERGVSLAEEEGVEGGESSENEILDNKIKINANHDLMNIGSLKKQNCEKRNDSKVKNK